MKNMVFLFECFLKKNKICYYHFDEYNYSPTALLFVRVEARFVFKLEKFFYEKSLALFLISSHLRSHSLMPTTKHYE